MNYTLHPYVLSLPETEREKFIPKYANPGDAGLDLVSVETFILKPNESKKIATSVSIELPPQTVGLVFPRSGLAANNKITLQNAVGVIDSKYIGIVSCLVRNESHIDFEITPGMKIAQLVVMPFITVDLSRVEKLSESVRGTKGFGSSGI